VAVEHSGGALSVLHDTMGDTGADITVMSNEACHALGMEVEPCNESIATSSGVNGRPLGCVKGGLILVFKPGTPEQLRVTGIKCFVMAGKSLPYNLLIGNDVLTPHNFYVKPRDEHMYYSPWLVSSEGRDMREARIPMNIYSAWECRTAAPTAHALHAAAGGGGVNTTTHPTHCTPETTARHVWHLPPRCLAPPTTSCVTHLASQRRQRIKSWPSKTHASVTPPDPARTRAPVPPATTPPAVAAAEPSAPVELEVPSAVRETSIRNMQARQQRPQQQQEEEELSEEIARSLAGSVTPTVSVKGATSEPLRPHTTASTADMPNPVTAPPAAGVEAPAPSTTEAVVGEGSTATPTVPVATSVPPTEATAPARYTADEPFARPSPWPGRSGAPATLSRPVCAPLGNVNPVPCVQIPINLIDRGGGPVPTLFPPPPAAELQYRETVQQALGITAHFHPCPPATI